MKYRSGGIGRVFVSRFDDGEDFIAQLSELARKENVRAAVFFLVGGVKGGRVVVGPKGDEMPPDPVWDNISGNSEMLGTGTIFWDSNGPKAHLHVSVGRGGTVKTGCLRRDSSAFLVLEAVVMEITGIEAGRLPDPESGMQLLGFTDKKTF